jgi:hypothetical protein
MDAPHLQKDAANVYVAMRAANVRRFLRKLLSQNNMHETNTL